MKTNDYQKQNVKVFDEMYKKNWGNDWPSETMISYYYNIVRSHIFSGGGYRPKVLEFACGTGANLLFFHSIGFEVYGIDSSESAIDRCVNRSGFSKENFSAKNILSECRICDIFPGIKFDLIICLSALSYFNNEDIFLLNKQFSEVLREDGIIYTNMYTTLREWPLEKSDNGLYIAMDSGSVNEVTYLNLIEDKNEIQMLYDSMFETIAIKRTIMEGLRGDNESVHYIGRKLT
ncbi:hypothetical protein IMSAGC009_00662 [Lachnospiraceae bacterium]|nr:hypothetical protein IMSAGC009_00662 [Lachnospiraceae bacterium]